MQYMRLLRLGFLLFACGAATDTFAYSELCVAPEKVSTVSKSIVVPPKRFDSFMKSLNSFASRHGYVVMPSASPKPSAWGYADMILLKRGTAEGIDISNKRRRDIIVARMSECGSKKFLPYWREFIEFVRQYETATEPARDLR